MQLGFVFVLICVFFEDRLENLARDIMHIYINIEEIASYLNFAATLMSVMKKDFVICKAGDA